MEYFALIGIIFMIMGYITFTNPNSIFAKFLVTLIRINHRIKGSISIIFGITMILIGVLIY